MAADRSEGWDAVADRFVALRSDVGAALVRSWVRANLSPGSAVVDVGCGSGVPITGVLVAEGCDVSGIDASPTLLSAFQRRFPDVPTACEAAQDTRFFDRTFDAVVAVGLLFLLSEADQDRVMQRVAAALKPEGRFLFSAPARPCRWTDRLTNHESRSLGRDGYARLLRMAGMRIVGCDEDEGGNHYFDAVKERVDRCDC